MTTIEDLFTAIADGDATGVHALLHADPSLAAGEHGGVSTLRAAAYAGHSDLAPLLAAMGAEPDAFDAATLGDVEGLRAMLEEDPTLATAHAGDGFTALHLTAWFGQVPVVEPHERGRLVDGFLPHEDAPAVVARVSAAMAGLGAVVLGETLSPITGGKSARRRGAAVNLEYLLLLARAGEIRG